MKKLLNARRVRERYDICERTLHRWERQSDLGFPAALVVNRRKYFNEDELDEWERHRVRYSATADRRPEQLSVLPRGPPRVDQRNARFFEHPFAKSGIKK